MGKRPKLPPISEGMKRISALLCGEILQWPNIRERPMFGLRAFYRGSVVFAMLPKTRSIERPMAIAYKVGEWRLFDLKGERDIGKALTCLDEAYRKSK